MNLIRNPISRLTGIALLILASLFTSALHAAEPVSKSRWGGVAIGGHDSVAYHQLQKAAQQLAVEGSKSYVVEYKGARWLFATEEASELFSADPDRYSPAYNGYCANALSLGEGLVRTDGTHWSIFGDKLYLFYAAGGEERWNDGNWEAYKVDADAAWEKLSR
jgi:YHS domain-containing protein